MRKILFTTALILIISFLPAEEEEIKVKKPFKAVMLSLFVPGGGQFYNESYVKSGVVFALEATLLGFTAYHHFKSEDYYDKYKISGSEEDYNDYLDYYYKRESDLWWLGAVVFLSMMDAYVDAYLFNFKEKKNKIHLKFEDNMISLSYSF